MNVWKLYVCNACQGSNAIFKVMFLSSELCACTMCNMHCFWSLHRDNNGIIFQSYSRTWKQIEISLRVGLQVFLCWSQLHPGFLFLLFSPLHLFLIFSFSPSLITVFLSPSLPTFSRLFSSLSSGPIWSAAGSWISGEQLRVINQRQNSIPGAGMHPVSHEIKM